MAAYVDIDPLADIPSAPDTCLTVSCRQHMPLIEQCASAEVKVAVLERDHPRMRSIDSFSTHDQCSACGHLARCCGSQQDASASYPQVPPVSHAHLADTGTLATQMSLEDEASSERVSGRLAPRCAGGRGPHGSRYSSRVQYSVLLRVR